MYHKMEKKNVQIPALIAVAKISHLGAVKADHLCSCGCLCACVQLLHCLLYCSNFQFNLIFVSDLLKSRPHQLRPRSTETRPKQGQDPLRPRPRQDIKRSRARQGQDLLRPRPRQNF